jgi:hypothetical protein
MNGTLVVVCLVFVIFVLAIIYVNRNTTESFSNRTVLCNYYPSLRNGKNTSDVITTWKSQGNKEGADCWISTFDGLPYPGSNAKIGWDRRKYAHCNKKDATIDYRITAQA